MPSLSPKQLCRESATKQKPTPLKDPATLMMSPTPARPAACPLKLFQGSSPQGQTWSARTPCRKPATAAAGESSSSETAATPRSFWFEGSNAKEADQAGESSCTASMTLPDWLPAFELDPIRLAAMTPSTTTPSPEDVIRSNPVSPGEISSTSRGATSPPWEQRSSCHRKYDCQLRKVFVGGIPKSMEQHELRMAFSRFGKVQKAWLQHMQPAKEHRGFGFVVFADESSMDQLLGNDYSRYVNLENGTRVEVKRALNENDIQLESFSCKGSGIATPTPRSAYPRATMRDVAAGGTPCRRERTATRNQAPSHVGLEDSATPLAMEFSYPICDMPAFLQGVPPMSADYAATSLAYGGILPSVPSFPVCPSPLPRDLPSSETVSVSASSSSAGVGQLFDILSKEFLGQLTYDAAELALLLGRAMPDHYED